MTKTTKLMEEIKNLNKRREIPYSCIGRFNGNSSQLDL